MEKLSKEAKELKKELIKQMLALATTGFGLVAALAWNELIQEIVTVYIKPLFGKSSGIVSMAIYAVFITAIAVLVTYQLSKLAKE